MELREHAPASQVQKSAWRTLCRGGDRVREEEELREEEEEEGEKWEEDAEELDAG